MAQQEPLSFEDPRILDSGEAFLTKNLYPLVFALIALLIVACGLTWWLVGKQSKEEEAFKLYASSATAGEWKKIIQTYPVSSAAALATIDLAQQETSSGNYEAAVSLYQDFLQKFSKHPAASAVELALAVSLESAGKTAEAKAAYNGLLASGSSHAFSGQASIGLARIYLEENNLLAARQTLSDYVSAHEESGGGNQAREMLNSLPPAAK